MKKNTFIISIVQFGLFAMLVLLSMWLINTCKGVTSKKFNFNVEVSYSRDSARVDTANLQHELIDSVAKDNQ